jgi:hypothetical protein
MLCTRFLLDHLNYEVLESVQSFISERPYLNPERD